MTANSIPTHSPLVLTTDFGLSDAFLGVMKGVILGINPLATIIDLTHDIQPQNLRQASLILGVNHPYFPSNAIHVAVVDPGVGTERRAVLLRTPTAFFLAPDNGLLSGVLKSYMKAPSVTPLYPNQPDRIALPPGLMAYELTNSKYWLHPVSNTFHGRDVFAPAAAHLSLGVPPQEMGEPISDLIWRPLPEPTRIDDQIHGEIIYIDRFGNLITNIHSADLGTISDNAEALAVETEGVSVSGLSRTFHRAGAAGSCLAVQSRLVALIGSNGYLEMAVSNGNASQTLGLDVGASVQVGLRR